MSFSAFRLLFPPPFIPPSSFRARSVDDECEGFSAHAQAAAQGLAMSASRISPTYTVQPASGSKLPKSLYIVVFALSTVAAYWWATAGKPRPATRKSSPRPPSSTSARPPWRRNWIPKASVNRSFRKRASLAPPKKFTIPPRPGVRAKGRRKARRECGRKRPSSCPSGPRRGPPASPSATPAIIPPRRRNGSTPWPVPMPRPIGSNGSPWRRSSIRTRRRRPPGRMSISVRPPHGWTPFLAST